MSRVKVKEELVYFPKNIRKNKLQLKQEEERPKTTPHRRIFTSRGYRFNPEPKQEPDLALATLELNNAIYIKNNESPQRRNTRSFLEACRVQKSKENKIKYNTIEGKIKLEDQNNNMDQFVSALIDSNFFFQKLERTMVQSLTLIGLQKKYEKGEKMELPRKSIGFVLYGKVKLFEKDYLFIANRGDTVGEHQIFGIPKAFKLKILEDCAILWVSIANYCILRQESVKEGFRHQFNKMDTQLRLSYIKKRMPKE